MSLTQTVPFTVVETPEFLSATRKMMSETDRGQGIDYLAHNPRLAILLPELAASANSVGVSKDVANGVAPV